MEHRAHHRLAIGTLFSILLVSTVAAAGDAGNDAHPIPPDPGRDAAITAEAFLFNDAWLADDARNGRETGTEGCRDAATWIADRLDELGLAAPEGAKDHRWSWQLPGGNIIEDKCSIKVTSAKGSFAGTYGKEFVDIVGRRSHSVSGDVVFAGYGITADDIGYDDYAGLDVKGKVVLVLRHEPRERDPSAKRWNADSMTRHSWYVSKVPTAEKNGAAALLVVTDPLHHDTEDLTGGGGWPRSTPGIPVVQVSWAVADHLLAGSGTTLKELQTTIDEADAPASRALEGVSVSLDLEVEPVTADNLVAVLPGADPELREEYVVVGAHYDHVGLGVGGGLDRSLWGQIHNGADDNASGTSALLEIAEHFALTKDRPRRSLLFLWFSGEEKGLLGSRAWMEAPLVPNEKVVAMLNMDMVGRYRPGTMDIVGATSGSTFKAIVEHASEGLDLEFSHTSSGMANSDGFHFHEAGIPTIFFFTGLHDDYHRPADDWWLLNAEGAARVATLAARTARALADADDRPVFERIPRRDMQMRPRNRVVLGVVIDTGSTGGARLQGVAGNSPASRAGLRSGDVILKFGETLVTSPGDLRAAILRCKAGETVTAEVMRGEESLQVEVKFPGTAPRRPLLGVVWEADDDAPGVVIKEVTAGGVAAQATMGPADRVLVVDGKAVKGAADVDRIVRTATAGATLSFKIRRKAATLELDVTLPKE